MVGVNRYIGVTEVGLKLLLVVLGVGECLGEWVAVDQVGTLTLLVAPLKEALDHRVTLLTADLEDLCP